MYVRTHLAHPQTHSHPTLSRGHSLSCRCILILTQMYASSGQAMEEWMLGMPHPACAVSHAPSPEESRAHHGSRALGCAHHPWHRRHGMA